MLSAHCCGYRCVVPLSDCNVRRDRIDVLLLLSRLLPTMCVLPTDSTDLLSLSLVAALVPLVVDIVQLVFDGLKFGFDVDFSVVEFVAVVAEPVTVVPLVLLVHLV